MEESDPRPSDDSRSSRLGRVARGFLGVYLVLLLLSHGARLVQGRYEDPPLPVDRPRIETAERVAVDGEVRRLDREIRLAYHEWTPPAEVEPEGTVLLVHGSPGAGSNFSRLGPLLAAEGFRVLAPDLPGFGKSTQKVADYSIRAHAAYCAALLDHLGVQEVHAVGFSLGGGVALHLVEELGPRVSSLTLLASVGVQELELLGSYGVNHAVHGVQLAAFYLLQEGFPHFGLLDRTHVHLSYARNFFDSDQRPLRNILESYDGPMAVVHGRDDFLVPYEAALEHRRIVPQSTLTTFEDGDHFLVFNRADELVPPLVELFWGAENGTARLRSQASPERAAAAREGIPHRLPRAVGPTLLVWIFLLAVATLVSEDLTCLAAGLLVAQGSLGFLPAVFGCALGIFIGDLGLYGAGRAGRPFLHRAPLRWMVKPADLEKSAAWFDRRGAVVILISRFVPGLRVPTYVTAGLLGMRIWWFTLALLIPILLWTPLLVGLAYLLGDRILGGFEAFEGRALPVFFGVLIAFWITLALGRSLASGTGRRRLLGRWRRFNQWEFWPQWAFYPPVIAYVVGLALKHRSPTLFTAANPGMPAAGGLVGESKSEILDGLDPATVAPWRRLAPGPVEERRRQVQAFVEDQGTGLPVVLKPDVGERGSGVVIARREEQIDGFLAACPGPAIVQRYVPGVELGIFWVYRPGDARGRIFSVTHKQLPEVVGDGRSTLEHLVLWDDRAPAMADTYLDRFAGRLEEVPAAGERIRLVEVGTHCLGAVFVDGDGYRTPELEAAVERIARSFEGFCFGRFDLRAPSFDHFRRGEELRVLELNGVSSEATHIYDPRNSLFKAWGILFEQWRLAFEIGRLNRELGHRPASLGEVWGLYRDFRSRTSPDFPR